MIKFLQHISKELNELRVLELKALENRGEITKDNTAIIVVDMVKGFYNEGPLQNEKVKEIINPMVNLLNKVKNYNKLFFVDSHLEDSVEFGNYPKHCVKGTTEEEIIDELKEFSILENSLIVKKNSINGFHCKKFKEWIDKNQQFKNFIIVGVCTDICVKNLAISLKTYFNEINQSKNIIVPKNLVETYDADFHDRAFMNLVSLYEMKSNGIEIIKEIR